MVYDWDPDVPPPDGYVLDSDMNSALLGAGLGLFAGAYFTSVIVAVVATKSSNPSDWSPLYVPVGGPFVAIRTLDASPVGTGVLVADGVMQVAGVLGFVLAFVDEEYKVIRVGSAELTPVVGAASSGGISSGAVVRF